MKWIIAIVSLMLVSCASSPKKIAYTSLSVVAASVTSAREAYVDVYKKGEIKAETHARVVDLDRKYTAVMLNAVSLAEYNYSAPASPEVIALAEELIRTIKEVTR